MTARSLLARAGRVRGARLYCLAFLSAGVITAGLTWSSLSQARIVPAATCSKIDSSFAWPKLSQTGYYVSNTGLSSIICGYPDLSGDAKTNVTTVYVDGYDGDQYAPIQVQVCSEPYGGGSLHCGSLIYVDPTITGNTSVMATGTDVTNAWGSSFAWDYGTVAVTPPNNSTIYGITTF